MHFSNNLILPNLDFFKKYNFFEGVKITLAGATDISGIYFLRELKSITLSDEINNRVDLSRFPSLEYCWVFWSKDLHIEKCKNLKKMVVHKPGEPDLQSFSKLENLEELEIVDSRRLFSLNGLDQLKKLKKLWLYILPKLEDFSSLSKITSLQYMHIETCKKMANLNYIKPLINLEVLKIFGCKEIDSLQNIKGLHKLQQIRIGDTQILDGDLTPLIGRENVFCSNYKNHSHTWKELEKLQKIKK